MVELTASIRERYAKVLEKVAAAARKARRAPESVRVVVVTKTQPVEVIEAAIAAGAHLLGENYAEEAAAKMATVHAKTEIEWHMIGHVQSRKVALVAQHFALIHSLDSVKLAQQLDRAAGSSGLKPAVLLEANVSGEASKYGWPAWDEPHWTALLPDVEAIGALPNLKVRGLMSMPPLSTDPEEARIYFRRLRGLRDFLTGRSAGIQWGELSMGTSADYEVAVEEGATLVRIGQAILGPRPHEEDK